MSACTVPPQGWVCTRAPGHDGPCAALPTYTGTLLPPPASELRRLIADYEARIPVMLSSPDPDTRDAAMAMNADLIRFGALLQTMPREDEPGHAMAWVWVALVVAVVIVWGVLR